MKANKTRQPGFYWVRFEGAVIVAEYVTGKGCTEEYGHWRVSGSDYCFKNREVCELLSAKLALPGAA